MPTIDYEVVMYICQTCNTTKSIDNNGDDIIEVTNGICFICKAPDSFRRLGKFILKKVIE